MLKKLRIKFIVLNMATVAAVLAVVFTSVVIINYQQGVTAVVNALDGAVSRAAERQVAPSGSTGKDASALISGLSTDQLLTGDSVSGTASDGAALGAESSKANGSDASKGVKSGESDGSAGASGSSESGSATDSGSSAGSSSGASAASGSSSATSSSDSTESSSSSKSGTPPVIGGRERGSDQVIPMAVFSVDTSGQVNSTDTNTASLSDDVLDTATGELTSASEGSGTLTDLGLIYLKRDIGGTMYLAFADTSNASAWQSLALTLTVVGVITLVVFLIISVFFSRWALRPVANAWAQQRRFVADASHDLKTPLTVILANTSIALEHPERTVASQAQWLESTQHEAEAMQGLVGDLLTLAKMDEEEATSAAAGATGAALPNRDIEKVDLSDLVEGELLQFESVAFERGVDLVSNIAEGVTVSGNAKRLQRLATTLIDNACKYVDESGRIDVDLCVQGRRAKLTVHNTGTPIPEEDLPHVFDRFYRADKARTSGAGGHGLGLAIAHAIAVDHGGELEVESSAEAGTTFTATLPVK
jgi:signal transduction histidine kinase